MKSNFFLSAFLVVMSLTASAQYYMQNVQLNDGSINQHNISDIDSMTFDSGNAVLHLVDGSSESLTISLIDSGYFQVNNRLHSCGADFVHNPELNYGSMTDQEGNSYRTITIGNQVWMAENLNTVLYQNGDSIEAYNSVYYNYDPINECPYGRMYAGQVVAGPLTTDLKVCPVGWHVPGYMEWITMLQSVDPNYTANDPSNLIGVHLKSSGMLEENNGYWLSPNSADNSSGFSALPGGGSNGFDFYNLNFSAAFWTSDFDPIWGYTTSFHFGPGGYDNVVPVGDYSNYYGSVRCVSDTLANGLLPGCTDSGACNYNSQATLDDGSCNFEGQTCDDILVGTLNDAYNADCICAGDTLYGAPHTCGNPSIHNPDLNYGTMLDQEGNEYKTIVIGDQKWMAENLTTSTFRNGDPIDQFVLPDGSFEQFVDRIFSTNPYFDYYNGDSNFDCPFGKLYNWYVIDDPRKVCPTGWHIPIKPEWDELIATVNTSTGEFNNSALALKSAGTSVVGNGPWPEPYLPELINTNSSGFSSLPSQGAWLILYDYDPQMSEYWVSGINENNFPYAVQLYANSETAVYYPYDESGYWTNSYIITQSIRCINDTLSSGLVSIPGCMDTSACNYDAAANTEDGSCRTVGSPCNDTFSDTHDDVWTVDCICAGTLITADPASCSAPMVHNPDLTYGTMTDQEGTTYKTIVIGTQEWMAENLATSSYRNGDPIPTSFTSSMTGECSIYMDDEANLCPHGRLYNWYAVTDDRHVCPTGWHEPSVEEWNTMIADANPGLEIADPSYIEGAGYALNSAPSGLIGGYWGGGGTNTSGLSLLPSGLWFSDGFYDNLGYLYFGWLTNNVDDFSAFGTFVGESFVGSNPITKEFGGTVRCVRD